MSDTTVTISHRCGSCECTVSVSAESATAARVLVLDVLDRIEGKADMRGKGGYQPKTCPENPTPPSATTAVEPPK